MCLNNLTNNPITSDITYTIPHASHTNIPKTVCPTKTRIANPIPAMITLNTICHTFISYSNDFLQFVKGCV